MRAVRDCACRFAGAVVLGFMVQAPAVSFGAPPEVIRDEFRVDQADDLVNATEPSVAADAAGNFIVVWAAAGHMWARQFDPAGTPVTDQFRVDPDEPGGETEAEYPRVIMSTDGRKVYFIWAREGADGKHHVMIRRHRLSSRRLRGKPRQVDAGVTDAVNPNLAIDPRTRRLGVVWTTNEPVGGVNFHQAYFRELSSSGKPRRTPVRLEHNPTGRGVAEPVYVAALGNGTYMAAWSETVLTVEPLVLADAMAQRVNAHGTVGASFSVAQDSVHATTSFPIARYVAAAGRSDGHVLMVWTASYPSQYHIFARLYGPDGNSLGNEERVDQGGDCEALIQRVASDPAGVFTVVWGDNPTCEANTRTDVEVYARRHGDPLRSEFRVGDMGPVVTLIEEPDVAASSNNLIVTWVSRPGGPTDNGKILAKVFANPPGPGY